MNERRSWFGSTLSRMGLMSAASPADPAAYTIMPRTAHNIRPR